METAAAERLVDIKNKTYMRVVYTESYEIYLPCTFNNQEDSKALPKVKDGHSLSVFPLK